MFSELDYYMKMSVQAWSAWTPSWCYPATDEQKVAGSPDVSWVPANTRRRLSSFAKMTFYVSHQVSAGSCTETIFASRHGDLSKTLVQLEGLAENEPLSPTQFALSVHNAVSGQFSIATENTLPSTTISAGNNTLEAALIVAYSRLKANKGLKELTVILADEAPPLVYQKLGAESESSAAIALRLSLEETSRNGQLSINLKPFQDREQYLQQGSNVQQVLSFLQSNHMELNYASSGYSWRWSRA